MRWLSMFVGACLTMPLGSAVEPASDSQHWPRFRGPLGTGQSTDQNLPTTLNANSVLWSAELPVRGHSSPIVWGDRIFLTGASRDGDSVGRHIVCLERDSGKVIWNERVARGSGERLHKMNLSLIHI